ncbi:ABC transporter ATP-binding protein [Pseudofulvibacter geojedonensis]|uniref:ABC transporter ATP-binding protein n=1 Tax=Pseudofulvibacter geojedonensis TaxID=1123758 RepID=A0ABW3I2B5_9FLAO
MKELKYLNRYFLKHKYRLFIGLLITVIARIFLVFTPKFLGDAIAIIETYIETESNDIATLKNELLYYIMLIIGVSLIGAFFTFLMRQTLIVMSRLIEFDLKNEVYQHYQKLSLSFYKQNRIGDLMNRISEDVGKVRMYFGPALMYSINTITLFAIVIPLMVSTAPKLAMYTLLPLPVLSIAIYKLSKEIHIRSTIVQQYLSKLTIFTQESFSGISVIKAYGLEQNVSSKFTTLSNDSKDKNMSLVRVQAWFFPFMILLIGLSNILVIYIGGQQYIEGHIQDIGTLIEFILYVNMLTWPVATVGWVTSIIQQAEASQKRINEFLKVTPEIKNENNSTYPFESDIVFNNVSFTYPDTQITALKNVSFKLEKGKTLAVIGKTGSGKSTLLQLVSRLYNINSGELLIGGKPINQHNLNLLRSNIATVPQDPFLFSDTIYNNIGFGIENPDKQMVIQAAKDAVVHDNILGFKNKYQTVLGERGITLSGGQKQRVSIARALIKNPEILLLDDCLSAVDTETEELILSNLNRVTHNATTIIVSHRISSAKNADQIIVLEKGSIIQSGTHQELVNIEGHYKDLYEKQLAEKEN